MKRHVHVQPPNQPSLFPEPKVIEKQETVIVLQLPPHEDLSKKTIPLTQEELDDLYDHKDEAWWNK